MRNPIHKITCRNTTTGAVITTYCMFPNESAKVSYIHYNLIPAAATDTSYAHLLTNIDCSCEPVADINLSFSHFDRDVAIFTLDSWAAIETVVKRIAEAYTDRNGIIHFEPLSTSTYKANINDTIIDTIIEEIDPKEELPITVTCNTEYNAAVPQLSSFGITIRYCGKEITQELTLDGLINFGELL
jgi:hypothetical protein